MSAGNHCEGTGCNVGGVKEGFSLLEMLSSRDSVLSLGALYQGATRAIQNVSVAEQYTRAVMLAESMIASSSYVTAERASISGEFDIFTLGGQALACRNFGQL